MRPNTLAKELDYTRRMAIKALAYIPKKSFYRDWIYRLNAEELEASKFRRLQDKLRRFYGEDWAL